MIDTVRNHAKRHFKREDWGDRDVVDARKVVEGVAAYKSTIFNAKSGQNPSFWMQNPPFSMQHSSF